MISKKFRLNEKELGKVLRKKKPFFSYSLIANTFPNPLWHNRCAILLSGKQTKWSVNRNYFRRTLYDMSAPYLADSGLDIVFVAKKWTVYNYKDAQQVAEFKRDIIFLWKTILKKNS